ncbi:NAD(P)H-binding protein [Actinoplanes sp. NPDC051494]|uniref:NAD(P)H-binding protein n=1 Tax=Actinoplanes sp. NPDC051494 TaxID=3363907 RepID=UPI0037B8B39D
MIAVTGATGQLGRLAVAELHERLPARDAAEPVPARDVVALSRPDVDYDRPESLAAAFAGVTRLLFVSSPEPDPARRITQHRAVIDAAVAAGVEAVVYTSFHEIAGLFEAHGATEEALAGSGLAYTVLRNPFYTDPFLPPSGDLVHATGGQPLNTAYRQDLAEAAVTALLSDRHTGRRYDLTGPLWTFPQFASSRGVVAREGDVAGPMGWLHSLARAGRLSHQTPDLAELLGRPARAPH